MGHMHRNWSCRQNLAGSFGDAELRLRSAYPLVVLLARPWEQDWELIGLFLSLKRALTGSLSAESGNVRFASLLLGVPIEGEDIYS